MKEDKRQMQVKNVFAYKWSKQETFSSEAMRNEWKTWLHEKYFDGDFKNSGFELREGDRFLDAGCGAGVSSLLLFGDNLKRVKYFGVDISDSITVAEREFSAAGISGSFLKSDLLELPDEYRDFDVIFSEGVLHHTPDVQIAIKELSSRLRENGCILFYVYKKKAIIREFVDDHVRAQFSSESPDLIWDSMRALTLLGVQLGKLGVQIEILEDIPLLGIRAGNYDLQRFFYNNIAKVFYNEKFSFEEMLHINFDWYSPQFCYRHTPEEIAAFCRQSDLSIERLHVDDSGISVIARK